MYINTHIDNMFYTHMVTVCGFISTQVSAMMMLSVNGLSSLESPRHKPLGLPLRDYLD